MGISFWRYSTPPLWGRHSCLPSAHDKSHMNFLGNGVAAAGVDGTVTQTIARFLNSVRACAVCIAARRFGLTGRVAGTAVNRFAGHPQSPLRMQSNP